MSRRIEDLHPDMQMRVLKCIQDWKKAGIEILLTCTWRSPEEQQALYDQGRTKPGKIVTRAKPGQSAHNFTVNGHPASLAIDIVPLEHGKPCWDEKSPVWGRAASIAKASGLDWYGDPGSEFHEAAHFQLPGARQIMRGTIA